MRVWPISAPMTFSSVFSISARLSSLVFVTLEVCQARAGGLQKVVNSAVSWSTQGGGLKDRGGNDVMF